jgi:hypothetical protein
MREVWIGGDSCGLVVAAAGDGDGEDEVVVGGVKFAEISN